MGADQKSPPGAVAAGYCDINYYLVKHALHVAPYGASHRAARPTNDATAAPNGASHSAAHAPVLPPLHPGCLRLSI